MSSILHTDFVAELVNITEVGEIVHPVLIPDVSSLPAISYTIGGGARDAFYRGSFGLSDFSVTLDVYTDRYLDNQTIVDAIVDHFNGFSGELNSNTLVQRISITSILNSVDQGNSNVYRTLVELQILA